MLNATHKIGYDTIKRVFLSLTLQAQVREHGCAHARIHIPILFGVVHPSIEYVPFGVLYRSIR